MNWLIKNLESFSNRCFLNSESGNKTYSDLLNKINEYKLKIEKNNIKSGDIVAVIGDYCFETISLFLALADHKCVVVPLTSSVKSDLSLRLSEGYVEYGIIIQSSDFEIEKYEKNKSEIPALIKNLIDDNRAGLILFSSGSSGKPKAMIHDLDELINSYQGKKTKELNFLIFLMFDHIGGLNTLLNALAMGVSITIPPSRDPDSICRLIEKFRVNVLPASPTFLNLILMSEACKKYDLSSLILVTYGTEPMPESVLLRFKDVLPRVKFLQTFGTSETGIANVTSKSSTSNLIKFVDTNNEFKIVDNELWLRSKTQVKGYLNASNDRFTEDGWFRTGDLVEQHEDGYLRIIGRNSDIINVGGLKVLPAEVEAVLLKMPIIAECLVYGKPNPITGQIVAAQIVPSFDMDEKEFKKQIRMFCNGKLDAYKIPVYIEIVEKTNYSDRFKKIRRMN